MKPACFFLVAAFIASLWTSPVLNAQTGEAGQRAPAPLLQLLAHAATSSQVSSADFEKIESEVQLLGRQINAGGDGRQMAAVKTAGVPPES